MTFLKYKQMGVQMSRFTTSSNGISVNIMHSETTARILPTPEKWMGVIIFQRKSTLQR